MLKSNATIFQICGPSFTAFQDAGRKTKMLTVQDCWLRQLTVCPLMSVERAKLISDHFPSFRSLAEFYRNKKEKAHTNSTLFDPSLLLHEEINEVPRALSAQLSVFFMEDCCK